MISLILTEIKKTFKNRFNLFLVLALFILCTFLALMNLHNVWIHIPEGVIGSGATLETFSGEPITSSKDFYEYADNILSKYEGQPSQAGWNTFVADYNAYYEQFTQDLDEEKMQEGYGEDWNSLWNNYEKNQLTKEQKQTLLTQWYNGNPQGSIHYYDEETDTFVLNIYYKDIAKLLTLNLIYSETTELENQLPDAKMESVNNYSIMNYPYYLQLHPDRFLRALHDDEAPILHLDPHAKKTNIEKYIDNTYTSLDNTYTSNVSMSVLRVVVQTSSIFILIVLSILCANTFSQEKTTKMDSIITCTKTGSTRIAVAKILANLCLCLSITMGIILLYLVIACIFMVPRGWSCRASFLWCYQDDFYYITYLEYFWACIKAWLTGAFFVVAFTSLFSYFTKNLTIIFMFAILIGPIALQEILPNWMIPFCPFVFYDPEFMITPGTHVRDPMVAPGVWFNTLILGFWIGITLLFALMILKKAHKHRV